MCRVPPLHTQQCRRLCVQKPQLGVTLCRVTHPYICVCVKHPPLRVCPRPACTWCDAATAATGIPWRHGPPWPSVHVLDTCEACPHYQASAAWQTPLVTRPIIQWLVAATGPLFFLSLPVQMLIVLQGLGVSGLPLMHCACDPCATFVLNKRLSAAAHTYTHDGTSRCVHTGYA